METLIGGEARRRFSGGAITGIKVSAERLSGNFEGEMEAKVQHQLFMDQLFMYLFACLLQLRQI